MIALFGMIYILFPILSTPLALIGLYLDKRRYKYYIFAIVLNLALIGYNYEPLISNDLYIHFISMDRLRILGFREILTQYSTDPLIIKNLWFYLVSLTNIYSFLPFSAVIIAYYLILKNIFDFAIREKIAHTLTVNFSLIILIFIQLVWVISGVRFSVSFALFLHGLYREFVLKKKGWRTYLFYLMPCFIHYSIFVLLLIRGLLFFKNKLINTVIVISMLIWGYFAELLVNILSKIRVAYIQGVALKGGLYLNYTNESLYMIVTNWMKLAYCTILIVSLIWLRKHNKLFYEKYKSIYDYCFLISLFCIGGSNIFIILDRFGFIVLALLPLVLMPLFQYSRSKLFKQLSVLSFIPIILVGLYFQYVPLKAMNYSMTFFQLFTSNIIRLFIK